MFTTRALRLALVALPLVCTGALAGTGCAADTDGEEPLADDEAELRANAGQSLTAQITRGVWETSDKKEKLRFVAGTRGYIWYSASNKIRRETGTWKFGAQSSERVVTFRPDQTDAGGGQSCTYDSNGSSVRELKLTCAGSKVLRFKLTVPSICDSNHVGDKAHPGPGVVDCAIQGFAVPACHTTGSKVNRCVGDDQ